MLILLIFTSCTQEPSLQNAKQAAVASGEEYEHFGLLVQFYQDGKIIDSTVQPIVAPSLAGQIVELNFDIEQPELSLTEWYLRAVYVDNLQLIDSRSTIDVTPNTYTFIAMKDGKGDIYLVDPRFSLAEIKNMLVIENILLTGQITVGENGYIAAISNAGDLASGEKSLQDLKDILGLKHQGMSFSLSDGKAGGGKRLLKKPYKRVKPEPKVDAEHSSTSTVITTTTSVDTGTSIITKDLQSVTFQDLQNQLQANSKKESNASNTSTKIQMHDLVKAEPYPSKEAPEYWTKSVAENLSPGEHRLALQALKNERILLQKAQGIPGIVPLMERPKQIQNVGEFFTRPIKTPSMGTDLGTIFKHNPEILEKEYPAIVTQILEWNEALLNRGILYLDWKLENIVRKEVRQPDGSVKAVYTLIDFGSSHLIQSRHDVFSPHIGGTPQYLAPEYYKAKESKEDHTYDRGQLNAFAVGALVAELHGLDLVDIGSRGSQSSHNSHESEISSTKDYRAEFDKFPKDFPKRNLILHMLEPDPAKRLAYYPFCRCLLARHEGDKEGAFRQFDPKADKFTDQIFFLPRNSSIDAYNASRASGALSMPSSY